MGALSTGPTWRRRMLLLGTAFLAAVSYADANLPPAPPAEAGAQAAAGRATALRQQSQQLRSRLRQEAAPALAARPSRPALRFEPNEGQFDPRARFVARGAGYLLFLGDTDALLALREPVADNDDERGEERPDAAARVKAGASHSAAAGRLPSRLARRGPLRDTDSRGPPRRTALRMKLAGARPGAALTGLEPLPSKSHYFLGNDSSKWQTNVPHYARVRYDGIYEGVDLVYYGNDEGRLQYDFLVAPGADPDQIRLAFEGVERIDVREGDLVLHAGGKKVLFKKPFIYQEVDGKQVEVAGGYLLLPTGDESRVETQLAASPAPRYEVAFELAAYDASRELVIDPELIYSTYLGGSETEDATMLAVGPGGSFVVGGYTDSLDFPTLQALQPERAGTNLFVSRFSASGGLEFSTYLGGSEDGGLDLTFDRQGNIYGVGGTANIDFPVTFGAFQPTYGGGSSDAFVFKLSADGSELLYSTYLGGSGADTGHSLVVDKAGTAYVFGTTRSADFPATGGAYQTALAGSENFYVARLNAAGSDLVFATYLGAGLEQAEFSRSLALDGAGDIYITGWTTGTTYPTVNPFQATRNGGIAAVVSKLSADGSTLLYSTYLGGSGLDVATSITVDDQGHAYVTGRTGSTDFPTLDALQPLHGGGQWDIFLTKLAPTGSSLVFSTYWGGSDTDTAVAITRDAAGNLVLAGVSWGADFPLVNEFQGHTGGLEAVVVSLTPDGQSVRMSTYLGGSLDEAAGAVATGRYGQIYVGGFTSSEDFPTQDAFQPALAGDYDAFVSILSSPAATHCVNPDAGGCFATIQAAIDAAAPGDFIEVHPRVEPDFYFENVLLNKSVYLIGVEQDDEKPWVVGPTVEGGGTNIAFEVAAGVGGVAIDGFRIVAPVGVVVNGGAHDVQVSFNDISAVTGMLVEGATRVDVFSNRFGDIEEAEPVVPMDLGLRIGSTSIASDVFVFDNQFLGCGDPSAGIFLPGEHLRVVIGENYFGGGCMTQTGITGTHRVTSSGGVLTRGDLTVASNFFQSGRQGMYLQTSNPAAGPGTVLEDVLIWDNHFDGPPSAELAVGVAVFDQAFELTVASDFTQPLTHVSYNLFGDPSTGLFLSFTGDHLSAQGVHSHFQPGTAPGGLTGTGRFVHLTGPVAAEVQQVSFFMPPEHYPGLDFNTLTIYVCTSLDDETPGACFEWTAVTTNRFGGVTLLAAAPPLGLYTVFGEEQDTNPVPVLSSIAPDSATAGGSGFTLTATGADFVNGAVVRWNGSDRTTTFVDSGTLTAAIPASDIASPGTADVTVFNPAPGGGESNALELSILEVQNPAPIITSLNPTFVLAGSGGFTLTVNGANFVSGAVVRWNGSPRATTFVSSAQVTASIPGADVAAAGIALVTVFNPAPGGGTSAASLLHVVTGTPAGTAFGWGNNLFGQVGDGSTTHRTTPSQVSLTGVFGLAAGDVHSLGLGSDQTVWAWGRNLNGQLGDGTFLSRHTPVPLSDVTDVVAIAGGAEHSLTLRSDGTVWAWGFNSHGQLGDGTTDDSNVPVQVSGLTDVVAVAAGSAHSMALKSDGTVWAWGSLSGSNVPVQVSGLTGVVAVASGGDHSLALKSDGTVWAWGFNSSGQLGDGTTTDRLTPVQVSGLTDVVAIAGGGEHSLALRSDGTVWAWGFNFYGQLGDGTTTDRHTPVQTSSLTGVVAVAASGQRHSLAVRSDGTAWSWGWNSSGQLGDGTTTDRHTPVQVSGLAEVRALAGGGFHSLAIGSASTVGEFSNIISVEKLGSGSGTVTSNPAGIACGAICDFSFSGPGTVVLTATPATGSTFEGWAHCTRTEGNTCEVDLDENFDEFGITATFSLLPPVLGGADSKGTEFWLTFPPNISVPELSLFIAAETATTGSVSIAGLGFSENFSVTPGVVTTVGIPPGASPTTVGTPLDLGIRVVAEDEVSVYGLNRVPFTTDAYLGLPVDILGTEYLVMAYVSGGSQLAVVAVENGTNVEITLPGGAPESVSLDRGQVFLRTAPDVTGTVVTSTKPVAVFGSNQCTNVPPGASFCDHLVEQMPPTSTWGQNFVTMPLATRLNGDTFRILAAENGTAVSLNGVVVANLNRGQFHERIIAGPAQITASKPVLVAQYSNGTGFDNVTSDPFMMLVPPFEQFLTGYTITTPATGFGNHLNLVVDTSGVGSILLDGVAVPAGSYVPIGTSGFSGAQVAITQGSHTLSSPFPFGVSVYGFASFDSYGYPGGMSLSPVATVASITLTPPTGSATANTGFEHCVLATVRDSESEPVPGIRVDFLVLGANPQLSSDTTTAEGEAGFCYTGVNPGTDTIRASVGSLAAEVEMNWFDGPADVSVIAGFPATVETGLSYVLGFHNAGPGRALGSTLRIELQNFRIVSATPSQGSCTVSLTLVECALGTVLVGGTATVTVVVEPPAGGWARQLVTANSLPPDPGLHNNHKTISWGENQAPLAHAGAEQVVSGVSAAGAAVALDGRGSSDPDGNQISYRWTGAFPEGGGVVFGPTPTVTLPLGVSVVTLVVSDGLLESAPAEVRITVSDYVLATNGTSTATVKAGQSASYALSLSPLHGAFTNPVSLACANLAAGLGCSFTPAEAVPGASGAPVTLTVSTSAALLASATTADRTTSVLLAATLSLPLIGVVFFPGRRRRRWLALGLLALVATVQAACGGGQVAAPVSSPAPASRSFTVTVTATTPGGLTRHTEVNVNVQP
jgi:alpha-tubulin suppressor-like RCC1 family protein